MRKWVFKHVFNNVGPATLNLLALYSGLIEWPDKKIVILDLDGSIADDEPRQFHLFKGEHKDWKSYYAEICSDKPIDIVYRWVKELAKECTIVVITGRPDTYQFETVAWLKKHDVPYDLIFMRPSNSRIPDYTIKKAFLDFMPREKVWMAIDDRPNVIAMFREEGVRVIPVRGDCAPF